MERSSYKVLVLGDYQMQMVKCNFESKEPPLLNFNIKWNCSQWANIKSAKKEYFKYKSINGVPDIIILSVGNNDLKKVSSLNCVLTSLLRAARMFKKEGVHIVVLCTLVELEFSVGIYNSQISKINKVLENQASKLQWMHVFKMLNKGQYEYDAGEMYCKDSRKLGKKVIENIVKELTNLLKSKKFEQYILNEDKSKRITQSPSSVEGLQIETKVKFSKESKAVVQREMQIMRLKLSLLLKEKSHTDEKALKLDDSIIVMTQYLSKLEDLASK